MQVSGYCPIRNTICSINVSYVDASTYEERIFIKGRFRCDYTLHGSKCDGNDCPIYKNAPDYKR